MAEEGLSQEEIDALLEGSGLDDFDSSYIPDEEEDIFSVDSGASEPQKKAPGKNKKKSPKFTSDKGSDPSKLFELPNLQLLYDVKMTLTVEIGRTRMQIKDVIELGEGSIIELNKTTEENVEILVNNMLIARGIVVVVGDGFGVQISEIITHEERFKFILS